MTAPEELALEKMVQGGDALGRGPSGPEGLSTVFVPYGAPGDRVRLHRLDARKNFTRGWIQSLSLPSPDRVDPPCPVYFKPGADPLSVCGGCDWQHLSYPAQLSWKKSVLVESFQRLGRIPRPPVEDVLPAASPWRYRHKVQIPVEPAPGGGLAAGFYAPESHRIVPFDDCLVQTRESVRVFQAAAAWLRGAGAAAQGLVRHLVIRTNRRGQALAAVVTREDVFPRARLFAKFLTDRCPFITGVFQNVNSKPGNVVLGPKWRHWHGKTYLVEEVCGLRFRLSPGAFFQVNPDMAEKLYELAASMADPGPDDAVLELYAGVGAMGQLLASRARSVLCVEEHHGAVADGEESARWNGLDNVRFLRARCEDALRGSGLARRLGRAPGAAVVDPPRAGCGEDVLRALMRLTPRRIVYVSCDPGTLARDARYLSTGGYHLKRCAPVDMFSQTSHVESVSLFEKPAPR